MIGDFPLAVWNSVGIVGLLALTFFMLATGRLVTRREHEGRIADKDAQLRDAKEAAKILSGQVDEMLNNDEVTHALLRSLIGVKDGR